MFYRERHLIIPSSRSRYKAKSKREMIQINGVQIQLCKTQAIAHTGAGELDGALLARDKTKAMYL